MKRSFICQLFLGTLILSAPTVSRAAIGTFSCSTSGGTPIFSTSVSYYDVSIAGVTSAGSGVSGAGGTGVGKPTLNPLVVHTPLTLFSSLSLYAAGGTTFAACTLLSNTPGAAIEYDFQLVSITTVEAIAKTPRPRSESYSGYDDRDRDDAQASAYTSLTLSYGAVRTTLTGA